MNFRLTAILFGAVLVGVVALLIVTLTDDKDPPTGTLLEELAPIKEKPEQIDSVEIEQSNGTKLKLTKVAKDRWDVEWDSLLPTGGTQTVKAKADPLAVNQLVSALLLAKPTAYPGLRSDPAAHGLAPPSLKVTLRQGSERSSTINFGDVASSGTAFVTTSSRPKRPMAVSRRDVEALFREGGSGAASTLVKWAPDFRGKSVLPADTRTAGDDVKDITLTARGKTLALERTPGGWKFKSPTGWGEADAMGSGTPTPGTFSGVRPLLGAITSLQALTPADFVDVPPAELAQYGLNPGNPDAVEVKLTTKDGETATAFIGKPDVAPTTPNPHGMPQSGKRWVRIDGQPGIIRANAGDLSGLISVIENPDPLRDRTLLSIDKSRINGIDVVAGGQTLKLRRPKIEWMLYGNPAAGDPQPAIGADALVNLLTERRTITAFPPLNDGNFPARLAEVKVWAGDFETAADPKAEPKEPGKPIVLLFSQPVGDSVFVRRTMPDGSAIDFKMPVAFKVGVADGNLVKSLTQGRLEYLDKLLKGFAATVANRLTVTGLVNFDVELESRKDGSAGEDSWVYAAPADRKGQVVDTKAVEGMLDILATTPSVTRIVDENPDAAKLAEYGLAPIPGQPVMPGAPPTPRLKVVVGLKAGDPTDKDRIYEFGNVTGEFVYARQIGRNAVFTLPKFVFEKFTTADLRDKNIFRFDPTKVTNLKLKGWGGTGVLLDLNFAKNKDGWDGTVSANNGPAGPYDGDSAKVNGFLNLLSRTRVKAFVPGPVTGEQGFGDPKYYLIIEVTRSDGPLISVNLAAPTDGDKAYFGWTNLLPPPTPVFTVDTALLKPYKDSSGAFKK